MIGLIQSTFIATDASRRRRGETLQRMGFGTIESASHVAFVDDGFVLRDFGPDTPGAPDLLIVPAPIKSASLWDLLPAVSVVQRARLQGFRVWRIDWTASGDFGLSDHASRFLMKAIAAIGARTGRSRPVLAGHSLGGTFVGLFAARHPESLAAALIAEGPLAFGPDSGPLTAAARAMMPGAFDDLGAVMPGSLLGAIAARVVPQEFHWWRLMDRASSALDPGRMRLHMAVDRWAQDERAMPRRLFLDVLEHLYRKDEFMAGRLQIGGAHIGPTDIVAPVLAITDPDGLVVPESAVRPALAASRSRDLRIIPWRPEPGTALRHVSALVGPDAHARLWPAALGWARAHALNAG